MAGTFQKIFSIKELRNRIIFTILMLGVYRMMIFVPVSGLNRDALSTFFKTGGSGTMFGLYDMFTGGALQQFSIITLGIMPYISASIILQLLVVVVPHLENLQREGEAGRRKITQYTRYGTVVLALIQGMMIALGLLRMGGHNTGGQALVLVASQSTAAQAWWVIKTVSTLIAGTCFIMWLGEQITERGIGNGISLIIFAGIVARLPRAINEFAQLARTGEYGDTWLVNAVVLMGLVLLIVGFIVFVERAQRRIPVQYAKRVVGRAVAGGHASHLPLKVNPAGVIPPIFASSIILLPGTILTFLPDVAWLQTIQSWLRGGWLYNLLYASAIIFFTYFYTAVTFNPTDVADNMKKYGGFVPGIRAGKKTAEYIDWVLTRLTTGGALYLTLVCLLPTILTRTDFIRVPQNVAMLFGGTSVLILVGVAIDTVAQIESHLLLHHYDGLLGPRGSRLKSRRGS